MSERARSERCSLEMEVEDGGRGYDPNLYIVGVTITISCGVQLDLCF
jgi:hypothetical protein